ncbi:MAG: helix-turn-helix domain-containing protein [Candidatus Borkfalkia sp.]
MSKYKLILEYYLKGNNRTQIATLCGCSRMTVWRVLPGKHPESEERAE